MANALTGSTEKCTALDKNIISRLWQAMERKFPSNWHSIMGRCINPKSGNLEAIATEWAIELNDLTTNQIGDGIKNLTKRTNKAFPPNAMEFKELCTGNEWDEALDQIMCKLQDTSYQWTNQVAFNIWYRLEYNPSLNETSATIAKKALKIYNMMDKNSMFGIPKIASIRQLPAPSTKSQKEKQIFQKNMSHSINKIKPSLFLNPNSQTQLPPLVKKLFEGKYTQKLIAEFEDKKYKCMDKFLTDKGVFT